MPALYLDARAEHPAPQTIPVGLGGFFDWEDASDETCAARGWPRYEPPPCHPVWERVVSVCRCEADGTGHVDYEVVSADRDAVLAWALAGIAARRWTVEVGGLVFNGARIPTDREVGQPRIRGAALNARLNPDAKIDNWKVGPGAFVSLSNADCIALGQAWDAHLQGCFDREAALSAMLAGKKKTETLRAAYEAELDKGWPGESAAPEA